MYYTVVLWVHSYVRWLALLGLLLVLTFSTYGWLRRSTWPENLTRLANITRYILSLQFVLGLLLYFVLSPFTRLALTNFGEVTQYSQMRIISLDHPVSMIVAIALYEIGSGMARRKKTARAKYNRQVLFTLLALLIIVESIPWPGTQAGRPLLRGIIP